MSFLAASVGFRDTDAVQGRGGLRRRRALAGSIAAAAIVALAVGIGGTARSEGASWPDGRVAALWPTFSSLPRPESGGARARPWDGSFRRCIESARVRVAYRCVYADARGQLGYVCLSAGVPVIDLSAASIHAVVAPTDPTFAAASPGQVCVASLAYALSLG